MLMGKEENTVPHPPEHPFRVTGRDAIENNVVAAFEHARHSIAVYAPILEASYFNSSRVFEALKKLCANGQPNLARFLVEKGNDTLRYNGRITGLAQRMSDFVALRQMGDATGKASEMFIVIDKSGYLHQPDIENRECLIEFESGGKARALLKRFDRIWEHSVSIPGLHVLGLGR